MSHLEDGELDRVQHVVGGEFLYIRDGDDRYVILDRGFITRADEAMQPMRDAKREVKGIKRERKSLRRAGRRQDEPDAGRDRELEKAADRASARLDDAREKLEREMRVILREAKERHLAERAIQE